MLESTHSTGRCQLLDIFIVSCCRCSREQTTITAAAGMMKLSIPYQETIDHRRSNGLLRIESAVRIASL